MIAVDAMGGDCAPDAIVRGAFFAAQSGIEVSLFGDEERVISVLLRCSKDWEKYPNS